MSVGFSLAVSGRVGGGVAVADPRSEGSRAGRAHDLASEILSPDSGLPRPPEAAAWRDEGGGGRGISSRMGPAEDQSTSWTFVRNIGRKISGWELD